MNITNYIFPIISEYDRSLPLCIFTVGSETYYEDYKNETYRPNGIPHHQFLFTANGAAVFSFGDKQTAAGAGSFVYHSPNTIHKYVPVSWPWTTYWVTFSSNVSSLIELKNGVYNLNDTTPFIENISQIINLKNDFMFGEKSSILLYKIILQLKRNLSENISNNAFSLLKPAVTYIHENFTKDTELKTLSDLVGITPGYFCKLFKESYHMRPTEYIQKLRIQKAKSLLLTNPGMQISEISEKVGYRSTSYFIKHFKSHELVTPFEFCIRNIK